MQLPFKPLVLALSVSAACALSAEEARVLGEMSVSASRSDTKLQDMPLHTTVISREEIERSPAQSLDQLLRNTPGMNFSGVPAVISDPTGQSTKMRGMGNAKVLVLLDGIPIHDPFYLTTQWYKVPLSNVERVEVIRGGASSLWGNMATAGVVNIISRRPKDNGGEFTASVGTQGTTNIALSKNFVLSDSLSVNLAVDNYRTDGYASTPAEYRWRFPGKDTPQANNSNIQLSAFYKPSTDLSGYLRIGYHIQDQDLGYQTNNNLQQSPDMAAGLAYQIDSSRSIAANAWAQYVRFEKYNGNSCYLVGGTCKTSSTAAPSDSNSPVVQFYSQYGSQRYREQGGAVVYSESFKGSRWTGFQLGYDVRRLTASDAETFYGNPTSLTNTQVLNSSTYGEGTQLFQGLFAQTKFLPLDALEITASGRLDQWSNGDRLNSRSKSGTTVVSRPGDDTEMAFNPSLAARLDLTDAWSMRASAYKAFRAPGFNNTTRTYGTSTSTTIANPDLKPERLTGFELGADWRVQNASLGATYFLYRIKDMIATYKVNANSGSVPSLVSFFCGTPAAGKFPSCDNASSVNFYTNDQDGESHGFELTGNWKVNDALAVNASFTRTDTFLTRRGAAVTDPLNVQLAGVPRDVGVAGVSWKVNEKLKTYLELRYIGAIWTDTTSSSSMVYKQGSNTIANASASYALDKSTDLFVAAVNLFDRQYSENAYKYDQPYNATLSAPRMINAGVKVRF